MKYFLLITTALAGMTGGLLVGIAKNGFSNIGETFMWGTACAVLITLFSYDELSREPKTRFSNKRSPSKQREQTTSNEPRTETEGSFQERMERFSENLAMRESADINTESKMPFWSASDTAQYQRSPPKSLALMRMLLQRIRRVLSGR